MERVGMIGVGVMGLGLAQRFLTAGKQVTGFDVNAEAVKALTDLGGRAAATPREVAEQSDLVQVVVGFDREVEQVCLGEDGVLSGAFDGKVLVISSTVLPETVRAVNEVAVQRGGAVLDVPMTRGKSASAGASFLLLVGGEEEVIERCRPLLEIEGDELYTVGGVGDGQMAKIVNNMLLWASVVACFEGMELAEKADMDVQRLRNALTNSTANSWVLEGWDVLKDDSLPWAQKDLSVTIKAGERAGLGLPLSHMLKERMFSIRGVGKGE